MSDPLENLPPLREVIAQHGLRAEKSLGQNFILDANITDKIVRIAGDLSGVHAIEIGPGPGGLTRSLLRAGASSVTAVEFDPRAIEALQSLVAASSGRLTLIQADALSTDLTALVPRTPRAVVANLPYNIATPLLISWLRQIYDDANAYASLTLMFQREVADRITAQPGGKDYGRLSILAQFICDVRRAYDIPPSAFVPPPKVVSSVVHFIPKPQAGDRPAFETLEKLTAAAFGQRRKMLRASLKGYEKALETAGIDPTLRAEQLTVAQFITLAKALDQTPPTQ